MTDNQSSAATDDPTASKEWNEGCDFALERLGKYLGIDLCSITWDGATETVEGDVDAVIGNILRAKFGEDWGPDDAAQAVGMRKTLQWIADQRWNEDADLDDICTRADRELASQPPAAPVEEHDPSQYCDLDACKREGCTHRAERCLSKQKTAPVECSSAGNAEPVAWRWNTTGDQRWRVTINRPGPTNLTAFDKIEPLYAAQPQTVRTPHYPDDGRSNTRDMGTRMMGCGDD
jgi:hypothetical protein